MQIHAVNHICRHAIMSVSEQSAWDNPIKMGLISFISGAVAHYSHFLNVSLGPVFWLLILIGCAAVSFGTGVSGTVRSGVRLMIKASKPNDWIGLILSLAGMAISSIAIYRAVHALKHW